MWKKARGFERRYLVEYLKWEGYRLWVTNKVRLEGYWKAAPYWSAFIDNDFLGQSQSLEGAKLICVLHITSEDLYGP